jgi:hypothetical protein
MLKSYQKNSRRAFGALIGAKVLKRNKGELYVN